MVRNGSKAEELTASTTSLLHPWELTIQQTLRLGGSGPKSGSSLLGERAILPEVAVDEKMTPAASGRGHFAVEIEDFAKASDLTGPIRWFS
jgi:hypothetical protein